MSYNTYTPCLFTQMRCTITFTIVSCLIVFQQLTFHAQRCNHAFFKTIAKPLARNSGSFRTVEFQCLVKYYGCLDRTKPALRRFKLTSRRSLCKEQLRPQNLVQLQDDLRQHRLYIIIHTTIGSVFILLKAYNQNMRVYTVLLSLKTAYQMML